MILNHSADSIFNSKRRAADFPFVMKLANHESSDNQVISTLFGKFFASTYSSSPFNANNQNYISEVKIIDISFMDQYAVSQNIQQLKSYLHTVGPDLVPSSILNYNSTI